MGLKAKISSLLDVVFPPVAPFVTMIAEAITKSPEAFYIAHDRESQILHTRLSAAAARAGLDEALMGNGVGVDVDFKDMSIYIVTYYFDNIELNWRERRVVLRALDSMLDAHEDAHRLASA